MKHKPYRIYPYCKSAIWGGDSLCRLYGKKTEVSPLAETWELSVRDGENCTTENGETLASLIARLGNAAVSPDYDGGYFPLLIKYIDAKAPLSIQVHPRDEDLPVGEYGKTEMWVILKADDGAFLYYGLMPGVTADDYRRAVEAGDTLSVLRPIKVKAGDVYFIPAGMPHAIGAGIVLAEIQQNCDTTYRVYDYDRVGADGKKRPLHTKEALAVIRPFSDGEVRAEQFYTKGEPTEGELLSDSAYFRTERFDTRTGDFDVAARESFLAILCVEGKGEILVDDERIEARAGDSFFLPAHSAVCRLSGNAVFLTAGLPGKAASV